MVRGAAPTLFNDSVEDLLGRVECRRAESIQDKEKVYRLRYRSYRREGTVAERSDERFTDAFDEEANSWSFGVYLEGVLASSLRLSVATETAPALPAATVFPDILEPMLAAGQVIVDPTRFVVEYDFAKQFTKLPYITVRIGWLALAFYKADVSLATVRSEHQAFYKRLFGHRVVCPPRPYPSLLKPISVMALDYDESERARVETRYPFLASTAAERAALFAPLAFAGSRRRR